IPLYGVCPPRACLVRGMAGLLASPSARFPCFFDSSFSRSLSLHLLLLSEGLLPRVHWFTPGLRRHGPRNESAPLRSINPMAALPKPPSLLPLFCALLCRLSLL